MVLDYKKVFVMMCGVVFLSLTKFALSKSYEFDIAGEWKIPGGVSGKAARIRFHPAGATLVSHLEIEGMGRSNDFTSVGAYSNNNSRLCGDNQWVDSRPRYSQ